MKDLIKHVWQRIKCRFGNHELSDSQRLEGNSPWFVHEFAAPVTGDKIVCYRREFNYVQSCIHCAEKIFSVGYDQKPHETDPFENTKKTKANSKGLHLTEAEYEHHVRKLRKESP